MAGQLLRSGPWQLGLNNRDEQQHASDLVQPFELRFLMNLDVTDSGVLNSRLGCRKCGSTTMYTDISTTGKFSALGSVEVQAGKRHAVVACHDGGSPGTSTFRYTVNPADTAAGWLTPPGGTLAGKFSTLFQYNNLIYFVGTPGGGATGQSRTAIDAGVWTAVAALPKGDLSFVIRERAFIIDKAANRLYWSKATDPATWAAPDGGFVDINPGDGQLINDAVVVTSQLYLFKRNKTFLFTFTSDPAIDGQLTLLSGTVGAYSAVSHPNGIFVVNDFSTYRLVNNFFADIGVKQDMLHTMSLNIVGDPGTLVNLENDTLIVGPVINPFIFTHAAMNMTTGAWSFRRYENATPAISSALPNSKAISWRDSTTGGSSGGAGNIYGSGTRILSFTRNQYVFGDAQSTLDVDESGNTISPEYSLSTSEYTAGDYDVWKRLFWAGARVVLTKPTGDNAITLRPTVGPDLSTPQQTGQPLPTATGGKVALKSFRFRSLAWQLVKSAKNLAALDPNTPSALTVKEIEARMGSFGRQVNVS